jgi:formate dehydrogenase maturation protein FdhE
VRHRRHPDLEAQHAALDKLPAGSLPGPSQLAKAKATRQPPLDPATWQRDESWRAVRWPIVF